MATPTKENCNANIGTFAMDPELIAAQQLVASLRAPTPPPPPPPPAATSSEFHSPSAAATFHESPQRDTQPNSKTHLDFAKRILAAAFRRPSEAPAINPQFAPGRLFFSFDLSKRSSGPPHVVVRNARTNNVVASAPSRLENDSGALDAVIREIRRSREPPTAPRREQPLSRQTGSPVKGQRSSQPNRPTSAATRPSVPPRSTEEGTDSDSDIFGDAGSDYDLDLDVEAAAAPLDESTSLPAPPTSLTDHSALPAPNTSSSAATVSQKRRHRDIPDDLDAADLDMEMAGAQAGAMGFSRTVVDSDEDSDEDVRTLSHLKERVQHKLATSGVYTAEAPRKAKRQKREYPIESGEGGSGPGASKGSKS